MAHFSMVVENVFFVDKYVVVGGTIEKGDIKIDEWVSVSNPNEKTFHRSRVAKIDRPNGNSKTLALFLIIGWLFDRSSVEPGAIINDIAPYDGWG